MTTILVILACVVTVGVFAMFYEMRKLQKAQSQKPNNPDREVLMAWLKDMREAQQQNTDQLRGELDRTNKAISQRLDSAAKVVQSVGTEVGKMSEIGQSMKELQQVLKSPKLRGNLGEQIMKDLLEQMLPKAGFKLQHKFQSGDVVDAVVKTKNGLIPIDSKFPVEPYLAIQKAKEADRPALERVFQRDIKSHIDKISKKYIQPGEKTVDFAFMYVPGEAVYGEIVANTELCDYGASKKVYLVSPNTFHLFLKTVMMSLEGERIEERAKQVMVAIRAIRQDTGKLGDDLGVLGRHVTNAKNMMETVNTSYNKLGNRVDNTGTLGQQAAEGAEQLADQAKSVTQKVSLEQDLFESKKK